MNRYDPLRAPDPKRWLGLTESERLDLIDEHHRRARIRLPNAMLHAGIHAAVETQVAMDDLPVAQVLQRLQSEGLDRHEAIHAVGSVLSEHMFHLVREGGAGVGDPNLAYWAALERLTAKSWKRSFADSD